MLYELQTENRAELIARSKARIAARSGFHPTTPAFDLGISLFMDPCIGWLQTNASNEQIARGGALHGREFLKTGLPIDQLVHLYGESCQAVTEFAIEHAIPMSTEEYKALHHCLDQAVAEEPRHHPRARLPRPRLRVHHRPAEVARGGVAALSSVAETQAGVAAPRETAPGPAPPLGALHRLPPHRL